jgi:hypothetical protein
MRFTLLGLFFAITTTSATWRSITPTTELECDPITTDVPTAATSRAVQNATANEPNVYINIYEFVYLELCPTGLRPVTTTVTETCTGTTSITADTPPQGFRTTIMVCSVCAAQPTTVTLTVPCPECGVATATTTFAESMPTYTTLTVFHAPMLLNSLTSVNTTSNTLFSAARTAASNEEITNEPTFTSVLNENATATVQPFSGDTTITSLSFPFMVSVMGITIVGVWFL